MKKSVNTIIGGQNYTVEYDSTKKPEITFEMIKTADANKSGKILATKSVYDVQDTENLHPKVYEPLYTIDVDGQLTSPVRIDYGAKAEVVFLEHVEGGEANFAKYTSKPSDYLDLAYYNTAMKLTREVEKLSSVHALKLVENWNRDTKIANNALFNHLHLAPVLTYAYTTANKSGAVNTSADKLVNMRETIVQARKKAIDTLPEYAGEFSLLIAHPTVQDDLNTVLTMEIRTDGGKVYPKLVGFEAPIYYKGLTLSKDGKKHVYPGVDATKAYLCRPRGTGFMSFVQEEMTLEIGNEDVTRGIREAYVFYNTLGVWAVPKDHVIEITLP